MRVDQLIKPIDVRWVDLEDSRLYGVEEIGRRGSESFWSVVVVGQNCPCQIQRSGCQLKWTDWFREARGVAELNQRAGGSEYRARAPERILTDRVVDNLYSLATSQLEGVFYEVFRAVIDYRCAARLESDLRFLRSRYCSNHVNPKRSCPLREDLTHSTSCSVVQDGISFVELNGFLQQVTCCQSLEQAAGCLVVCYSIGNCGEAILRIETHRRVRPERIGVGYPVPNLHQRHVRANRFDDSGCFVTDDRWKLRDRQCSAAIVDVYKIETDDGVSQKNLVTDGIRNFHGLKTKDIGLSILVDTCSCCFGRHIALLETCMCAPVLSPDWRQHRSESQVDAFTRCIRFVDRTHEFYWHSVAPPCSHFRKHHFSAHDDGSFTGSTLSASVGIRRVLLFRHPARSILGW